ELDEALPDVDHTLPNCGVPFDIDRVGQCCGDGGQQQYDHTGCPHPSFYSVNRRETTTYAADAVYDVPSFRHQDGVTSSDGAVEMAVPIAPFDAHADGVYSFATSFRYFPRASRTDDETCAALTCHEAGACALATLPTLAPLDIRDIHERVMQAEARQAELRILRCAALTCDEAGACALATLPTVAPLDLRHIHERVVLAEASRAALEMLRQTADLQRLFLEWEGTMVCHAIDPDDDDDDDDHSDPPHRLHLRLGKERDAKSWSAGASRSRACWRLCDGRRPAPLGDQRVGDAVKMLGRHGGYFLVGLQPPLAFRLRSAGGRFAARYRRSGIKVLLALSRRWWRRGGGGRRKSHAAGAIRRRPGDARVGEVPRRFRGRRGPD
ncbi:unnamed protein product, partial [Ectocarpus sp. 6 AP-2014]